MNLGEYAVVKADKELFAVYQTVYANADTNLQFDWKRRLGDTTWSDDCHWVMQGEQKIGGIILMEDAAWFAFLIAPFADRALFWRIVHAHIKRNGLPITKMLGVLDCDVDVLQTHGYKVGMARRMMCRPTDRFALSLDSKFISRAPIPVQDVSAIVTVNEEGYKGSIDYEVFGIATREEIERDINFFLGIYAETGTLNQSSLVFEKSTDELVGICMAGKDPKNRDWVSGVSDITVLPAYRGCGIAEFMQKNALTEARKTSQLMELCVTVGNSAENLYRKLGFWGGPKFTAMSLR